MNKTYSRINWENYPSTNTAVNAENLNTMDSALNEVDNRVISLDTEKATKTEVATTITSVSFDESTGIFTFTRKNGTVFTIDTLLEKLAINFDFDVETQMLIVRLEDGTTKEIDLSALITIYEFTDSDTISLKVDSNGNVNAQVINGSITDEMLESGYLAKITVQAETATKAVSDAQEQAKLAQSYAKGGTGSRDGEDTDNAKYYMKMSQQYGEGYINKEDLLTATQTSPYITATPTYSGKAELSELVHNYFDKSDITAGYAINDETGGVIVRSGCNISDYIYVKDFKKIFVSKNLSSNWHAFYDKNKNYIIGFVVTQDGGQVATVPDTAVYLRCSVINDCLDTFQVTKGNVAHPYIPYTGYEVKSCGKNLLNVSNIVSETVNGVTVTVKDEIVTLNGTASASANIVLQNNIELDGTYFLSVTDKPIFDNQYAFVQIYSSAQDKGIQIDNDNTSKYTVGLLTASDDYALRVRLEVGMVYNCSFRIQLEKSINGMEAPTPYTPYIEDSVFITNDMDKAYIDTYDGVTNIFADTDITAKYAITENGQALMHNGGMVENQQTSDYITLTDCLDGKAELTGLVKNYFDADTVYSLHKQEDGSFSTNVGNLANKKRYFNENEIGKEFTFSAYIKNSVSGTNPRVNAVVNGTKKNGNIISLVDEYILSKVSFIPKSTEDYVNFDYSVDNIITIKDIMLSTTDSPYVPYSSYEVKSCGKQLYHFDKATTKYGLTFTPTGKGFFITGVLTEAVYIVIGRTGILKGTYSFYIKEIGISNVSGYYVWSLDANSAVGDISKDGSVIQFLEEVNGSLLIYINENQVGKTFNVEIQFMVCKSDVLVTDIEPYTGGTTTITQETEKAYISTYKDCTNIFNDYGAPMTARYGVGENANELIVSSAEIERLESELYKDIDGRDIKTTYAEKVELESKNKLLKIWGYSFSSYVPISSGGTKDFSIDISSYENRKVLGIVGTKLLGNDNNDCIITYAYYQENDETKELHVGVKNNGTSQSSAYPHIKILYEDI